MKILKCLKGNAEIWAEVHNTEWGSYEEFEVAFQNKYWSEAVSYTHLDVYKRQVLTVYLNYVYKRHIHK